jgi:hypothetical protein
MAITRTVMIDDDGSGTTGTVLNNAWLQTIYGQIDDAFIGVMAGAIPVTATGTVNNLAGGSAKQVTVFDCTNATALTITGFQFSTTPRIGDQAIILARGAGPIALVHNSPNSTEKLSNAVTTQPTPLSGVWGRAVYVCIGGGFWVLMGHEQGAWLTDPFNAADYTGSGGAWTVTAGQVRAARYHLRGRTLSWMLDVYASTLGGAGSVSRRVLGGYTIDDAVTTYYPPFVPNVIDSTGATSGYGLGAVNTGAMNFYRDAAAGNFPAGNLSIFASGVFEVK